MSTPSENMSYFAANEDSKAALGGPSAEDQRARAVAASAVGENTCSGGAYSIVCCASEGASCT